MAKIMTGEAMPKNLPEAIAHYRALVAAANVSEDDASHDVANAAFDAIAEGKYPVQNESDAVELLNLLADEASDSNGSYIDEIVVQVSEFLAKRASPVSVQRTEGTSEIRRWLQLYRTVDNAIHAFCPMPEAAMDTFVAGAGLIAEAIIESQPKTEADVADNLRFVIDLMTDSDGWSCRAEQAAESALAHAGKLTCMSSTTAELVKTVRLLASLDVDECGSTGVRAFVRQYCPALEATQ